MNATPMQFGPSNIQYFSTASTPAPIAVPTPKQLPVAPIFTALGSQEATTTSLGNKVTQQPTANSPSSGFQSDAQVTQAVVDSVAKPVLNHVDELKLHLAAHGEHMSPEMRKDFEDMIQWQEEFDAKKNTPVYEKKKVEEYTIDNPKPPPNIFKKTADRWLNKVGKKIFNVMEKHYQGPEATAIKKAFTETPSPKPPEGSIEKSDFNDIDKLLTKLNQGASIDGVNLLAETVELHEILIGHCKDDPELATTLHLIEEKAAERLMNSGNIADAFKLRSLASQIPLSPSHPLSGKISEKVEATPYGTHFSHLDTGIVKGGNIHGVTRKINGHMTQAFDFKISHPARKKLAGNLKAIRENQIAFQQSLPKDFDKVSIKTTKFTYKGKGVTGNFTNRNGWSAKNSKADVIKFEGKGKVIIGASEGFSSLYNSISIEIDHNVPEHERLETMQTMMSVLGLGPVFGHQRGEDIERMKMAQLFRAYNPSEAFNMERNSWFYEIPLDDLKAAMEAADSKMKSRWEELATMTEEAVYSNDHGSKLSWTVPSVVKSMRDNGAFGLMSGVGHEGQTISDVADTVCRILKNGSLSSQDRFQAGLFTKGASSSTDMAYGGGDSVFTRCITANLEKQRTQEYPFQGKIQILYDLDVAARGNTYGYQNDTYGEKKAGPPYSTRTSLPSLVNQIESNENALSGNEIMIKNRIAPNHVRGLVVQKQSHKDALIKKMRNEGLLDDRDYFNGKPINQFIHVAIRFNKDMWNKPEVT